MLTMPTSLPLYRTRVVTATYRLNPTSDGRYIVTIHGSRSLRASPPLDLDQVRTYVRAIRRFNAARREI